MKVIQIAVGLMLATFLMGWATHVHYGNMTTKRYVGIYLENVNEFVGYFSASAKKTVTHAVKPIHRPTLEIYDL